jgi:NTP pyrophosphatase (non-canonical NTP hydrolase)
MNSNDRAEIVAKLAGNGIWEQLNQLQEECAEVVRAVNRLRRKKQKAYVELCAEIADLKIMILQMEILLDNEIIEKKMNEKFFRIKERLASGQL